MAAESSLPHAECVKHEINLDEWISCAHKDFNFRPDDVSKSKDLVTAKPINQTPSNEETKALQALKESNKLAKVGMVTDLSNNRYLAWGSTPPDAAVTFYLLEPSSANQVLLSFKYHLRSFIDEYTKGYMGSCRPPMHSTVDFGFWINQSKDLVIVMGPAEEEKFTESGNYSRKNGCKLVDNKTVTVEEFSIDLPSPYDKEGAATPAAFAPDPRPGRQDETVIISFTRCASLEFDGTERDLGYPTRYNFADRSVKAMFTEKVMFGKMLHYIRGGDQIACLEHPEYDKKWVQKPQKIWVLNADTLAPLFTILHTGIEDTMLLLTSADNQYIAEVCAGYRMAVYETKVNVFKCPEGACGGTKDASGGLIVMNSMKRFQVEIPQEY